MEKKILIIEDEMIHGLYLKSIIENSGYDVIDVIPRGEDAILTAIETVPGFIISDILLKGNLTGVETIEQIQKRRKIPFIYLTALNDTRIIEKAEMTGPLAIIYKPYETKELLALIRMVFEPS